MAEYIEREYAKRAFQNMDAGRRGGSTLLTPEEFAEYLDDIPSVDAVPVVRCKDCKYNRGGNKCLNPDSFFAVPADDDFCSYGARRENQ